MSSSHGGRRRLPGALLASFSLKATADIRAICMPSDAKRPGEPDEAVRAFYLRVLGGLKKADAPFLVGGAYALRHYSGVERYTKDVDIFVRREDYDSVMAVLNASGSATELPFPHWSGRRPT